MNYVVMHTSIDQEPARRIEKLGLYVLISYFCYEPLGFMGPFFGQFGRQFLDLVVVRLIVKEIIC